MPRKPKSLLKSRFLDELPQPDALAVMKRNPMIILPVGTIELHGPHMPLGCDGIVSQALALLIAERIDCLVAPVEFYSFIGGTSKFPAGVSVPYSASMEFLRHIVRAFIAGGFERIVLMSFHIPNEVALQTVAREMFEETGLPIVNLRPFSLLTDSLLADVLGEHDDAMMEATVLAGALKLLGKSHLIDPAHWRTVPTAPLEPESARRIMKIGGVGFHYTSIMAHQPPRAGVDADKGIALLERAAESAAHLGKDLADYEKHLRKRSSRAKSKGDR